MIKDTKCDNQGSGGGGEYVPVQHASGKSRMDAHKPNGIASEGMNGKVLAANT